MKEFVWENRRQIFNPSDYTHWGNTHGQVPYYTEIKGQKKVFFTSRPPKNENGSYVSFTYSADIALENENIRIDKLYEKPLLQLGDVGCFDEFGTMPCSVVVHPETDDVFLYYVGWSRKVSSPYDCAIGLAVSKDNGKSFTKISAGPIISADKHDPFVLGCPRVHIFKGKWYMFYLSGIKWLEFNGRMECYYKLKMAVSDNGIDWLRNDNFIIPERYENECQTCASVFFFEGKYHMYFTYRHSIDFRNPERGYRIGYAYSADLLTWERNDNIGNFSVSTKGWDSEMVCYPNVNLIDGSLTMFYCGNSFGLHGFGTAKLKSN